MARTQQQRRAETVARLLDAGIETIIEIGYARASAAIIAKRAGLSVGALFRHYPTMGDFMAATGHEVLRRQLDLFGKRVAEIPADKPALESALTILRDVTGNDTNAVLYELMVAARTDAALRATLQHVLTEYAAKIDEVAAGVPGIDNLDPDLLPVVRALLTNAFDGAALLRGVLPTPDLEDKRIALLTDLLGGR
ncbi:TetR/AcrR family transcriptional regulator [Mycolicibacterium diernhoferi]|uniref:TetR family transcriptional regulator n=1 Tax=Mycolicibacterium diernhoferi TaxID=1801 RepID=A0A1Q4HDS5_9MYCO|nr:TetR/AcrR family transcriptional regulator [Mycolicibacterium diernhoferi]OJZ65689.1 TetR family transcriptional regulator [Mycolicibacterium diernhoferi]OPE44988.1 TetR family transcriptional regulator [Mycolicibacterium diernhoferi]PEG56059.1 TetR/AcrR family transcriptional regulator [Mycolicibacterium diernhoferi]QYL22431.1 TetR/AcrR family transcriptional regulator [Mycolicibacterium diernhoferi]